MRKLVWLLSPRSPHALPASRRRPPRSRTCLPTCGRRSPRRPVLTPDLVRNTMQLFKPLSLPPKSLTYIKVTRDLSYGPDPRNKLDVYLLDDKYAEVSAQGLRSNRCCRPVVIFIPGGGFVDGDKHANDAICANVGVYLARHGIVAVTANYRLAPQNPWPG